MFNVPLTGMMAVNENAIGRYKFFYSCFTDIDKARVHARMTQNNGMFFPTGAIHRNFDYWIVAVRMPGQRCCNLSMIAADVKDSPELPA
jgi:hypothetical protein